MQDFSPNFYFLGGLGFRLVLGLGFWFFLLGFRVWRKVRFLEKKSVWIHCPRIITTWIRREIIKHAARMKSFFKGDQMQTIWKRQ
jgi:hypothetical protein